jgi:hypothetical protein
MSNLKFKGFLRRPKPKDREPREERFLALLSLPEFQYTPFQNQPKSAYSELILSQGNMLYDQKVVSHQ